VTDVKQKQSDALTDAFARDYEELARWSLERYRRAESKFHDLKLREYEGRAVSHLAKGEADAQVYLELYHGKLLDEIKAHAVPACYGTAVDGSDPNDGTTWARVGIFCEREVAAFLLGIDEADVALDEIEIRAALCMAEISCEPLEADSEALDADSASVDPWKPNTWLQNPLYAKRVLCPMPSDAELWAVWYQGVWASALLQVVEPWLEEHARGSGAALAPVRAAETSANQVASDTVL